MVYNWFIYNKFGLMQTIAEFNESIKNCKKCILHKHRTQVVPWAGNPNASIMFIWEWPWKNEDIKWTPFVWAAWNFLNTMLESIGLSREDVFIANVVKCRPPKNRDPKKDEIKACIPYLEKQIKIISPKIVVTLWRFALNILFPDEKICDVHWKILKKEWLTVLALYHPAAALYNWWQRKMLLNDFQMLSKYLPLT